jgi:hypothetical protein
LQDGSAGQGCVALLICGSMPPWTIIGLSQQMCSHGDGKQLFAAGASSFLKNSKVLKMSTKSCCMMAASLTWSYITSVIVIAAVPQSFPREQVNLDIAYTQQHPCNGCVICKEGFQILSREHHGTAHA